MREIGGYFELELGCGKELYTDGIRLNSARNCLRYLIRKRNIKKIQIPAYTCPVVWEVLEDEGCEIIYYDIDENMLPGVELDKDVYVLYTNYFGVCFEQAQYISSKYKKVIIDNAQAFFENGENTVDSFNSSRKFFGVPDGGYLSTNLPYDDELEYDHSYERAGHLLKRIDKSASEAYEVYRNNESVIDSEDIKLMSKLTQRILSSIDYENCKKTRISNFKYLHNCFKDINCFKIEDAHRPAMVYPLLVKSMDDDKKVRSELIEDNIYIARYWAGQKDRGYGDRLEKYLLPLPIDQRYSFEEMEYMVNKIKKLI